MNEFLFNRITDILEENNIHINEFIQYAEQKQKAEENEKHANEFIQAIKTIANNEENLQNFESYLSQHFETWLKKYANTPQAITEELKEFANMEL